MVDHYAAWFLKKYFDKLSMFKTTAKIYTKNGQPYRIGDILIQKDYGNTLEKIAEHGADIFYKGEIAERIADLIKRAMLDALAAARREKIEGRLILQVHDELIFEVREDQAELARDLICEAMRNAAKLNVELKAESGIGSDWFSAHGG